MEQIIKTYGKSILEASILILLVAILFTQVTDDKGNQGILQIIGANIIGLDNNYRGYTDFDVFESDAVMEKPVITYTGSNDIRIGDVFLTDYIHATGSSGAALPVKVIRITNQDGVEIAFDENVPMVFDVEGIYTVTVSVVDEIKKETVNEIKILVNQ